ncbi:MAG TPA: DNA gyrase modulator, partial [Gemmatimonadaceae bacterium]|nr:DNA gyrase modulator [Gemmatimonadaceae bacterium]
MSAPRRLLPLNGGVLTSDEAQQLVERAVRLSRADEIEVNFTSTATGNTRFAANQMSTSGSVNDVQVLVQSSFGQKSAVVTTNDLSDAALERTVRQSEALARLSPDNPEAMPRLGPQSYRLAANYFESTANVTPDDRAKAALGALGEARSRGDLEAAGFLVTTVTASGLGNNKGLFAYNRRTGNNYTLTVRTADGTGSGWAAADHPDWSRLDAAAVSRRAIEKARLSRNPVALEPGRYTVILEPQAVGDLVSLLGSTLQARLADEG